MIDTPLWLSHHWDHESDRCVVIRGRHVCRRCVVLYPLSFAAALVLGVGPSWPDRLDPVVLWLLPLPAVLEFIGEHLCWFRHSPARLVALTVPLAVACGRLYLRYLDNLADGLVWAVLSTYGAVCFAAAIVGIRRRRSR